jgi:hypothetical protein
MSHPWLPMLPIRRESSERTCHGSLTCNRLASAAGTLRGEKKVKASRSIREPANKGERTYVPDRNHCGSSPATLLGTPPEETRPPERSTFRGHPFHHSP